MPAMADDEERGAPNLELPSLFGRRRRKRSADESAQTTVESESASTDAASGPASFTVSEQKAADHGPDSPVDATTTGDRGADAPTRELRPTGAARRVPPTPPPAALPTAGTTPIDEAAGGSPTFTGDASAPAHAPAASQSEATEPIAPVDEAPVDAATSTHASSPSTPVADTAAASSPEPTAPLSAAGSTAAGAASADDAPGGGPPATDALSAATAANHTPAANQPEPTRPPAPAASSALSTGEEPSARAEEPTVPVAVRGPEMTYGSPAAREAEVEQTQVIVEEPLPLEEETPRARSRPSVNLTLPQLPTRVAAAVVGLVVALTGVLMTWLILLGCTAVRGVASCGGVGLLGVVAVVVVQVLVGAVLLGALGVAESRSTAVLGVGLLSVVALVLGYASTPAVPLAVALLLLGPAAYVVAHGVTGSPSACATDPPARAHPCVNARTYVSQWPRLPGAIQDDTPAPAPT